MRNRRAIFPVLTFSVLALAGVFVACKDDTPSEFGDPKNDGGNVPDRVQGFLTDTGTSKDTGAVECKPSLPTGFTATFTPPANTQACTAAQIEAYFKSCLPTLDEQSCKDFLAANADCVKCIEAPDQKGPIQIFAVGDVQRYYYTLNQAGCVGLVQGKTGEDSCAKAFDTAVNCRRAACASCFSQEGAVYSNFTDCQLLAAESNACKEFQATSTSRCQSVDSPDGGAPGCFAASETAVEEKLLFTRIANAFCLKP